MMDERVLKERCWAVRKCEAKFWKRSPAAAFGRRGWGGRSRMCGRLWINWLIFTDGTCCLRLVWIKHLGNRTLRSRAGAGWLTESITSCSAACVSSVTHHQVTSPSTYTGRFSVWRWTAAARSSSWRRASPPRSGRQSPEPRVPEVPTGAAASAVRAPWLRWEGGGKIRQGREGWRARWAVTIKYLLKRAERKKKKHLQMLTELLTSVWAQDSGIKSA